MSEREPPESSGTPERQRAHPRLGLCPDCAHVRRITSAKGSVFWMCELARQDPRFPRYPVQPRLVCTGFQR